MKRRWTRPTIAIPCGLLLSALALYFGWQLPHRELCSGDVCETTLAIDWHRVDWGIPPERYACGVPHPGPGNVLIGPGAICVVADGFGELERNTYEELRTRAAVRRIVTLAVIGLILVVTAATATGRTFRRAPRG